jgi:hypothetical protein
MYASMFDVYVDMMMKKLWGENFFNPKTKKWSKSKGEDNKRSFCMYRYVLDPICMIYDVIMNFKKEETAKLLGKLTTADDKAVKDLLRVRKDVLLRIRIRIGIRKNPKLFAGSESEKNFKKGYIL